MSENGMATGERIEALDLALFDAIPSQTAPEDRTTLLHLQRIVRRAGPYAYLEIGSHLGGTVQPHYADPSCRRIYSIDKRPLLQPDERGGLYAYPSNSTRAMRENLERAFPLVPTDKLVTLDADASEVPPAEIREPPRFCFIDGEHTNSAVVSDFRFCLAVADPGAVMALHDSGYVPEGVQAIKAELAARGMPRTGMKLGGSVYAFVPADRAAEWAEALRAILDDERRYFRAAAYYRQRLRREARLAGRPALLRLYRGLAAALDWTYARLFPERLGRRGASSRGG